MAAVGGLTPRDAAAILWLVWIVSWLGAALWSARTVARPRAGRQLAYRALGFAGGALMFGTWNVEEPRFRLASATAWAMVAVIAAGQVFSWWARIYLGRLWSSTVTRKAGHRLIDTGPYAAVRHPIYTGLILSMGATAVVGGSLGALAGAALITFGWYIKARLEEGFLGEELGQETYDAYARRVPMLVPLMRGRRGDGTGPT